MTVKELIAKLQDIEKNISPSLRVEYHRHYYGPQAEPKKYVAHIHNVIVEHDKNGAWIVLS